MKKLFALLALGLFFAGCRKSVEEPKAYIDSLLAHPMVFADGGFEFRVNALPIDYFLARELALSSASDRDSLRRVTLQRYGAGEYYLLHIGLDSLSSSSRGAQIDLRQKMLLLQSRQEIARHEIVGELANGGKAYPDAFIVDADWAASSGVTILFSFRKEEGKRVRKIEFGKSFVYSRNQAVDVRDLEPLFRLKG